MAEISWIKLKTTMFDDEKIRLIQAIPESDAILVIWIRLLVLAGKTNDEGLIYIQRNMPYTDEMLATLFGKPINTVAEYIVFNLVENGEKSIDGIGIPLFDGKRPYVNEDLEKDINEHVNVIMNIYDTDAEFEVEEVAQ